MSINIDQIILSLSEMAEEYAAQSAAQDAMACKRAMARMQMWLATRERAKDTGKLLDAIVVKLGSEAEISRIHPDFLKVYLYLKEWRYPVSIKRIDSERFSIPSSDMTTVEFASETRCTCKRSNFMREEDRRADCWHVKVVKAHNRVVSMRKGRELAMKILKDIRDEEQQKQQQPPAPVE